MDSSSGTYFVCSALGGNNPVPRGDIQGPSVAENRPSLPATEEEGKLRDFFENQEGIGSLASYRLVPFGSSLQFDTERSIVSFRLLNGQYPLVSWLTAAGKEKIKDDSEMVDGGATAEQLGMKGVKWNLFFSPAYMVTGNHQRAAKSREAVARKAAKVQVPQTLYTERVGCHEGVTFPLDKLHFIGLIPITNGPCAYVCVLGYMEQSEALTTKGPMENDIPVNSEIGQFSGSGAYGAAVASNVPSGGSDSVYLHHPYPGIYDAPAARAAQDSEPVAAVSPINAHMYLDRSIRANALDEGLYQSHQHGCQWNINDYPGFPTN